MNPTVAEWWQYTNHTSQRFVLHKMPWLPCLLKFCTKLLHVLLDYLVCRTSLRVVFQNDFCLGKFGYPWYWHMPTTKHGRPEQSQQYNIHGLINGSEGGHKLILGPWHIANHRTIRLLSLLSINVFILFLSRTLVSTVPGVKYGHLVSSRSELIAVKILLALRIVSLIEVWGFRVPTTGP